MVKKQKKPSFLYRLFNDLYEVTLYTEEDDGQTGTIVFRLKELKKINQNYLKGIDENGHRVEFKTTKAFDYKVVKIY